jgi:surfactin synthase thioesterase subunit
MSGVLAGMAAALDRLAEPRYVLLGHSMGGLLAYEFAQRHRGATAARPALLVVSGCQAPRLRGKLPIRHTLADDALVAAMVELGAPPEPFGIDEIRRLALPVLRADLQLTEAWHYVATAPLDIPILALAGAGDPDAPPADMGDWSSQTTSWFDLVEFDGGHFFPEGRGRELAEVIRAARDRLDAG